MSSAFLLVVEPLPISLASSRGSGVDNLASADPKEVWADTSAGTAATITVDLGITQSIDTVMLGYLGQASPAATWVITGGVSDPHEQAIKAQAPLRVPEAAGPLTGASHALWNGAPFNVRYLELTLLQPAGSAPLTAGVLIVGLAFSASLNHEWGAGRRPIDTGTATALPSGGFAVVEGARKRALTWTFGDLTQDEVDRLEGIALRRGETATALVIEDATASAGLWSRIHYGLFEWKAFERRNRKQTRWEMEIEQWV
jgi:hypothetical protein